VKRLVLRGGTLVLPGTFPNKESRSVPGNLFIEDDCITALEIPGRLPPRWEKGSYTDIDITGLRLFPGLIDIHIHGACGHDFTEGSAGAINAVSRDAVKDGVTAFAASLTVLSRQDMLKTLRSLAALRPSLRNQEVPVTAGARFLGIHSEGPFISEKYKALMDERYIRKPDIRELEEMAAAAKTANGENALILMTFSPHYRKSSELLAAAKRLGIVMMIGHSEASADEAEAAMDCGAAGYTHLYNAMSGHHHRSPGVVTAALGGGAYTELIADTVHVCKRVLRLSYQVLGSGRIILVTDAMPGKSMDDGEFIFSGLSCIKRGSMVWVKDTGGAAGLHEGDADPSLLGGLIPGRLAGSVASLNGCMRNMAEICGAEDGELAEMAAANPAKLLGLYDSLGSLEPGKKADIAVFNKDYNPVMTLVNGEIMYRNHG
jgi:N-acetylglucosamine-6-phosphate deacetylase